MTRAQTELQLVMGGIWLESRHGCRCPDCSREVPRVLAEMLKLRGIERVEINAGFKSEASLSCLSFESPPNDERAHHLPTGDAPKQLRRKR